MRVRDLLTPLVGVMRKKLLEGTYVQSDEMPVNVPRRDGRPRDTLRLSVAVPNPARRSHLRVPHGPRAPQLDPHLTREGRTTRRRDPFHRRNLPPTQDPGARLPRRSPTRP